MIFRLFSSFLVFFYYLFFQICRTFISCSIHCSKNCFVARSHLFTTQAIRANGFVFHIHHLFIGLLMRFAYSDISLTYSEKKNEKKKKCLNRIALFANMNSRNTSFRKLKKKIKIKILFIVLYYSLSTVFLKATNLVLIFSIFRVIDYF